MTVIGEVREAVKVLSDVVEETRTILEALKDGQAYLRKHHPEARGILTDLLEEMRRTTAGLISVARIVTDFDFTVEGSALDTAPDRFNDYLIKAQGELEHKSNDLAQLKGSCHRVLMLQGDLQARAGQPPWWAWLGDRAGQQAGDLEAKMVHLYSVDSEMHDRLDDVLKGSRAALEAVRERLSSGGGPRPANVPVAQELMQQQRSEMAPVIDDVKRLRDGFADLIAAVDAPS
jgi:hypothetical protein